MSDTYRFVRKADVTGPYWFTEKLTALGDWSIVTGTLRINMAEAEKLYEGCVAGTNDREGVVLRTSKPDRNPLREIVRTLEIDCIVRYRVEEMSDPDELPNCYDIEIEVAPGPLAKRHPLVLECLEVELPVEEAEAAVSRAQDRYDEHDRGDWLYEQRKDRDMEMREQQADAMREGEL